MDILEIERLILRPFKEDDLDDFYEYAKNPDVGRNAGWKPYDSKEESSGILKDFIKKDEVWAIADKQTNRVIGSIGLHHDRKRDNKKVKMLGYVLAKPYWGKGLATEAAKRVIRYAFEVLELDLLSVYHYPFNNRSKRVIEKCGFRYEGTIRGASTLYDGSVCDDVCYSMTRQEYVSKTKQNE